MRILFVDDSPERVKAFREQIGDHDLVCALDFENAARAIRDDYFDRIYLDHDLSEEHYAQDCTRGTGSELAELIAARSRKFSKTIVILHSLNHPGRQRMQAILSAAMVPNRDAPWAWMRPVR